VASLLETNYWVLLSHGATLIVVLAIDFHVYIRARKTALLYSYLAIQLCFALWLASKILKSVSPNAAVQWHFLVVQFLGICALGPSFFFFSFTYARGRPPRLRVMAPLAAIALCFVIACATNPLHMQFYSTYDFFEERFGPLFYALEAYLYTLIAIGIVFCANDFRQIFGSNRAKAVLFLIAIFVPIAANLLFVSMADLFPFNLTPIAFTVSLLCFTFAIYRYRFLDITPTARRLALRRSPEAMLLLDRRGRPVACNDRYAEFARCLQPREPATPVERYLRQIALRVDGEWTGLATLPPAREELFAGGSGRVNLEVEMVDGKYFQIVVGPVRTGRRRRATLVRAIDVTHQKRTTKALETLRAELAQTGTKLRQRAEMIREIAITRARNVLARDVHDLLGHSVVLVVGILEVARLSGERDLAVLAAHLGSAAEVLKRCQEDIAGAIAIGGPASRNRALNDALAEMLKHARGTGIDIQLLVQGRETTLRSTQVDVVFRVFQESLTNAIRHGGASRVGLVLRYHFSGCELYAVDNGRGCPSIKKGFGLSGMEQRLAEIGGEARFASDGISGFIVRGFFPYHGAVT
jgi:signal transduction histidine kinase